MSLASFGHRFELIFGPFCYRLGGFCAFLGQNPVIWGGSIKCIETLNPILKRTLRAIDPWRNRVKRTRIARDMTRFWCQKRHLYRDGKLDSLIFQVVLSFFIQHLRFFIAISFLHIFGCIFCVLRPFRVASRRLSWAILVSRWALGLFCGDFGSVLGSISGHFGIILASFSHNIGAVFVSF